jgi:hypothetical protein
VPGVVTPLRNPFGQRDSETPVHFASHHREVQITGQMQQKGVPNSPACIVQFWVPVADTLGPFKHMGPPAEAPGIVRHYRRCWPSRNLSDS